MASCECKHCEVMAEGNVQLVRSAYAVFDKDLDRLLALLAPGVEWISPSDALEPGVRHGHQGVRDAFAATAMAWEEPSHTAEDFLAADDRVLVTVTFRGRGRGSGMQVERPEFHVWTLRGAAAVRFEWFYQRDAALRAAGLAD
jgi:ketosteroid isomerase-like protein